MFDKQLVIYTLYIIITVCSITINKTTTNISTVGTISREKCHELYWQYSKVLCSPDCFQPGGGGEDVPEGEYTHMAALGYGIKPNIIWGACCGSLISSTFVLTAAHCLGNQEYGPVKYVRFGVVKLHVNNGTNVPQDITVLKTFKHPDYKPPLLYNDIALIKLRESPNFGFNVYPACLHTDPEIDLKYVRSTGWGALKYNGPYPDHMQVLFLMSQSYENCSQVYNKHNKRRLIKGIDNNTQICAGGNGIDSCDGDSGGPLQVLHPNYTKGYLIIGVTSFGKPCLVANTPGVYTRVLPYLGWIENIVWRE